MLMLVRWIVFALFGLAMFALSFAGFWGDTVMIITAVFGAVTWGVLTGLAGYAIKLAAAARQGIEAEKFARWSNALVLAFAILSVVTTWVYALGAFASCGPAFLATFYHWGGVVGSLDAFATWFVLPHLVSGLEPRGWVKPLVTGCIVYGFLGVFWLVAWLVLRGDIDESRYPPRASSPYKLPYPGGESSWVVQGNNSSFNHEGREEFAWDFRRSCGTPVLAARAGRVRNVVDTNDGHGNNNQIEVDHGDGTIGRYLHIKHGSASVSNGDPVTQGAQLAEVGSVGNSLTGHIHFVVERGSTSIPVSFSDVRDDKGIPRTFSSYESGNR